MKVQKALLISMLLPALAFADVVNAPIRELQWFAGRWATGPADVPGYKTITPGTPDCSKAVSIRIGADGILHRTVTLRNGSVIDAGFNVKKFGGNYPWWPTGDGPGAVAKRIDENTFVLAATGMMGKADWKNAIKHMRCK